MENVSHLLPSSPLNGNTSMAATNTVSDESGSFTAPGSVSESSARAPREVPMVEIPDVTLPTTVISGEDGTTYSPWSKADGSAWVESSGDQSPMGASQPRDTFGRYASWRQT